MPSNFGHEVLIECDQVCGLPRYRANCKNCSYVSGWCTTNPPWPDAPPRPAHEAQARALSAAQTHLRGRLQVLPTQGPVPSWDRPGGPDGRKRQPSGENAHYSVAGLKP
jgi:hypothetical protein